MTDGTNVPAIQFTSVGFAAPSGPAVLAGVQLDINAAFRAALNFGLTTPQGQLASSWGAMIVNANSIFVYFAQQIDPAYASGRFQDAIGRIYFMERQPAAPTVLQVSCGGAEGVVIPVGSLVSAPATGALYASTEAGTIPIGGAAVLSFAAQVPGPGPVPQSIAIYQAIPGWDQVAVIDGIVGRNVEGRAGFEERRTDSVAGNSFGAIGSIIGAVAKVKGVLDYYGYNNNTAGSVTVNGVAIAAYSIYVCVAGGAADEVAAAIFSKKGAGAPMTGNTTVTVYDENPLFSAPIPYEVKFEVPTALTVLFKVVLADSPLIPSNAATQIQAALIAAFSGNVLAGSFVGSISGTTLTVSELSSGALAVGQVLSDLTGAVAANTSVTALGTGAGGVGTYEVGLTQNVASEPMTAETVSAGVPRARIGSTLYAIQYVAAIAALGPWARVASIQIGSINTPDAVVLGTIFGNTLTVVSVASGALAVGDSLFGGGGGIVGSTRVTAFGTGTGGVGTYTVNNPQTVGASFTGTGSGTNLTVTAVTGEIVPGELLDGTGVPGGTTIVSQSSGAPGGAGVYVTSNATTSVAAPLTSNQGFTAASANQQLVQVLANQEPQLSAPDISVVVS